MSVFSESLQAKIQSFLTRYETRRSAILPVLHAIQERLSMDDVLPRGRHTQFDLDEYVGEYAPDEHESVMQETEVNPLSPTNNLE